MLTLDTPTCLHAVIPIFASHHVSHNVRATHLIVQSLNMRLPLRAVDSNERANYSYTHTLSRACEEYSRFRQPAQLGLARCFLTAVPSRESPVLPRANPQRGAFSYRGRTDRHKRVTTCAEGGTVSHFVDARPTFVQKGCYVAV
jgi:hypothetical protein